MTDENYKDCCTCFFDDCEVNEYPCTHCRNNKAPSDPQYAKTPLLWCSQHCEEDTPTNQVNHPSHYNQGKIECIDAMVAAFGVEAVENFCLVNAFKYVWRSRDKNGFEDIDKAIWYLNKVKELNSSD